MATLAGDETASGEHARSDDTVLLDPRLQTERNIVLRAHVPDARDAALDVVAKTLDPAQRRIGSAVGHGPGRIVIRIREMRVQIDESWHDRLAGDIDHARIGRPASRRCGQDALDVVARDDKRSLTHGRARPVEDAAAAEHECSRWSVDARGLRHAPRIIGDGLGRRGETTPLSAPDSITTIFLSFRRRRQEYDQAESRTPYHVATLRVKSLTGFLRQDNVGGL